MIAPAISEVMQWARDACQSGRITQKLDEFLESPDPEHRKWAIGVGLGYGQGLPGKRADVDDRPDFAKIVAEASRRAQEHREERERERQLAPTPEPLNSAPSEGRPSLPPASSPLEPEVLPPEPVQPARDSSGWPKATLHLVPIVAEPPK